MELCRVTEKVYYSQRNIASRVLRVRLFSCRRVAVRPRRDAGPRGECERVAENSQEENTGWQNRVRRGNIDNFSSRRYAHFCASIRAARAAAPSAGPPGLPDREISVGCSRFLLFTPCQLGFCCVQPRAAPLAPVVSESEVCVTPRVRAC